MYKKRLVFWAACIGILFFGMAITTLGSVVPQLKIKFHLDNIARRYLIFNFAFWHFDWALYFLALFATDMATGFY